MRRSQPNPLHGAAQALATRGYSTLAALCSPARDCADWEQDLHFAEALKRLRELAGV